MLYDLFISYCSQTHALSSSLKDEHLSLNTCPLVVFLVIQDIDWYEQYGQSSCMLKDAVESRCKSVNKILNKIFGRIRHNGDSISSKREYWLQPLKLIPTEKDHLQYGFIAGINALLRAISPTATVVGNT